MCRPRNVGHTFGILFYAQDKRKFGLRVPERRVAGRQTNGGHQLLHTAGRLRARATDRQGVDDGGRPSKVAGRRVDDFEDSPSGRSAGRVGSVRSRGHGHQTAFRRPKKETVHRFGTHNQPVDIIPRRAHHVSAHTPTIIIIARIYRKSPIFDIRGPGTGNGV